MEMSPYICRTIERGNDLDTTLNFFTKYFRKNLVELKLFTNFV